MDMLGDSLLTLWIWTGEIIAKGIGRFIYGNVVENLAKNAGTLWWLKDRATNNPDADVRQTALQELARGWKSDPDAFLFLKDRAANDPDSNVRNAAFRELRRGWPGTVPTD
jgi:hypothetical protein